MNTMPANTGIIFVDEVPEDSALPQLAVVFNGARMQKVFQARLFDTPELRDRFRVRACEILRLRYKRGKKCMICYRLAIRDRHTQLDSEQTLCVRVFEPGGSLGRFNKAKSQRLVDPKFGRP